MPFIPRHSRIPVHLVSLSSSLLPMSSPFTTVIASYQKTIAAQTGKKMAMRAPKRLGPCGLCVCGAEASIYDSSSGPE